MIFNFGKHSSRFSRPFPPAWLDILRDGVLYSRLLTEAEQVRQRTITLALIDEKMWEGCGGQVITDEVKVVIAAQAAILLLGFDDYYFDDFDSILVYPGGYLAVEEDEVGDEQLAMRLGEALEDGPVALGWWHVRWGGRRLGSTNLVLHEFAHKLAELGDDHMNRPLLLDRSLWKRWDRVMTREREQLEEDDNYGRPTLLDPYGASNAAEFFAVATETFFLQGAALRKRHPEVYELLAAFYKQDPAQRVIPSEVAALAKDLDLEFYRQVVSECTIALKSHPDYLDAYRSRAEHLVALGDRDAALADYTAVVERTTDGMRAEALYDRGGLLYEWGRNDDALRDLNEALTICPDDTMALCSRGVIRTEQGDLEGALADLTASLRIDPGDDFARCSRAAVYRQLGKHTQALRDLDRAAKLNPHNPDLWADRADVLEALGRHDEAREDREKADRLTEEEEK